MFIFNCKIDFLVSDLVVFVYDDCKCSCLKVMLVFGVEVGIFFECGEYLCDGDWLWVENGECVVEIFVVLEKLIEVVVDSLLFFVCVVYYFGNCYVLVQILLELNGGWLCFQIDYVLVEMVCGLGCIVIDIEVFFQLEVGVYGGVYCYGDELFVVDLYVFGYGLYCFVLKIYQFKLY